MVHLVGSLLSLWLYANPNMCVSERSRKDFTTWTESSCKYKQVSPESPGLYSKGCSNDLNGQFLPRHL